MRARVGRIVNILEILFYKGIGAYNTLLVYLIFAPFVGNGSDIGLEALQIAIIVNLFGDVSPFADFCGITYFLVSQLFADF
jgi:hypothetical protein